MSAVILTGFMGTGKTTIRRLLEKLGKRFIKHEDLDILPELRSASIFTTSGNSRNFEQRAARSRVSQTANVVVIVAHTASDATRPLSVRSHS